MAKRRIADMGIAIKRDYGTFAVEFSINMKGVEFSDERDLQRKYDWLAGAMLEQVREFENEKVYDVIALPLPVANQQVQKDIEQYTLKEFRKEVKSGKVHYLAVSTTGKFCKHGVAVYDEVVEEFGIDAIFGEGEFVWSPAEGQQVNFMADVSSKYKKAISFDGLQ